MQGCIVHGNKGCNDAVLGTFCGIQRGLRNITFFSQFLLTLEFFL